MSQNTVINGQKKRILAMMKRNRAMCIELLMLVKDMWILMNEGQRWQQLWILANQI